MARASQRSLANSSSTGSGQGREEGEAGITFPPVLSGSSKASPASAPTLLVTPRRSDARTTGRSRRFGYVRLVRAAVLAAIHIWPGSLKSCGEADEHEHQFPSSFLTSETDR